MARTGTAGAVRFMQLTASELTLAERHGKRLDRSSQSRQISDEPPLTTTGLDLNELYRNHVEGAFVPKTRHGHLVHHMVVQFPKGLVPAEDQHRMLYHAREFAASIFGDDAIMADRMDQDEKSSHVVDLFIVPKYVKVTKKQKKHAVGLSVHLNKMAEEAGVTATPQNIGRLVQDKLYLYLRDVMKIEGVERGEQKTKPGKDWKAAEELRKEELDRLLTRAKVIEEEVLARQRQAIADLEAAQEAHQTADQRVEAVRDLVRRARAHLEDSQVQAKLVREKAAAAVAGDLQAASEARREAEMLREAAHDDRIAAAQERERAAIEREATEEYLQEAEAQLKRHRDEMARARRDLDNERAVLEQDRQDVDQERRRAAQERDAAVQARLAAENLHEALRAHQVAAERDREEAAKDRQQAVKERAAAAAELRQTLAFKAGLDAFAAFDICGATLTKTGQQEILFHPDLTDQQRSELERAIEPDRQGVWAWVCDMTQALGSQISRKVEQWRNEYLAAVARMREREARADRLAELYEERIAALPQAQQIALRKEVDETRQVRKSFAKGPDAVAAEDEYQRLLAMAQHQKGGRGF